MGSEGILRFREAGGKGEHKKDQIWGFLEWEKREGILKNVGLSQVLPNGFPRDIPGPFPTFPAAKQGLIHLL